MIAEIETKYIPIIGFDRIQFDVEFTKKKRPKKRRRSKDTINRGEERP